ncbi:MAG: ParB/RepB/Spo0J family partition protein [Sphingomonadaceae bacterium]
MTDAASEPIPPLRKRPTGLGRGLSALLGDIEREESLSPGETPSSGVRMMNVADLVAHPSQPRRHFDDDALDELAASIAARGVLQPIVVRQKDQKWQIVAGERRWRAAQRAQIHQVPVIVKELNDAATLEIALIENIQREQLNAIEEGETYRRLIREFGHSQDALGQLVHKSRSHIANLMRLLELPPVVRDLLGDGKLSMGHARALVNAPDPQALAAQVVARDLSVRETEVLARIAKAPSQGDTPTPRREKATDTDLAALERQLGNLLGIKVQIAHKGRGGSVSLHYSNLEQLDMICQRLSGEVI